MLRVVSTIPYSYTPILIYTYTHTHLYSYTHTLHYNTGTHVAGTLAGFCAPSDVAFFEAVNPYRGMAPQAKLSVGTQYVYISY